MFLTSDFRKLPLLADRPLPFIGLELVGPIALVFADRARRRKLVNWNMESSLPGVCFDETRIDRSV